MGIWITSVSIPSDLEFTESWSQSARSCTHGSRIDQNRPIMMKIVVWQYNTMATADQYRRKASGSRAASCKRAQLRSLEELGQSDVSKPGWSDPLGLRAAGSV
jgi:hypothetical protein